VPKRRLKAKHAFTGWAVVVYAFLFLPILVMAVFAFNKPSPAALAAHHGSNICSIPPDQVGNITVWNGFTSCWFSAGLHDPTFIPAIVTSLQIAAAASIIATVLGLCAALALARMKPRLRAPFDALVYLTLVVPEIVIAVASLIFFVQARNYIHAFPPLGKATILLGQVVFNASVAMLIIRARFVGMGDTLEEAAYDLGSGPLATFRQVHVLVRRLRPARVHERHDQHLADCAVLGRALRPDPRRQRSRYDHARRHVAGRGGHRHRPAPRSRAGHPGPGDVPRSGCRSRPPLTLPAGADNERAAADHPVHAGERVRADQ